VIVPRPCDGLPNGTVSDAIVAYKDRLDACRDRFVGLCWLMVAPYVGLYMNRVCNPFNPAGDIEMKLVKFADGPLKKPATKKKPPGRSVVIGAWGYA